MKHRVTRRSIFERVSDRIVRESVEAQLAREPFRGTPPPVYLDPRTNAVDVARAAAAALKRAVA